MSKKTSAYHNIVFISQISIHILVPTFLCLFLGLWIDHKFSTIWSVPLLFLGMLAGGRNAYMLAMNVVRKEGEERKKQLEQEIADKISKDS